MKAIYNAEDTICAIATPAGSGGVGIVRLSGEEAADILAQLVPDWPSDHPSHKLRLSRICDLDGALIDEALAVLMKAPKTYTAEDVVEFQCHGGRVILERVLDAAIEAGARVAEPGEFTQRAFLNGRLDLTQAEAVADLINAETEAAHELALEHLEGRLGSDIEDQLALIEEAKTLVEAAIDFSTEEHVYQIETEEVLERVDSVLEELSRLRDRFDQGRRRREGLKVVIAGRPNAGKSTIFNALHGTDRSIVTSTPGTTRDYIEEHFQVEGVGLRIVDTAGLRDAEDEIESMGVERSRQLTERADILLWIIDQNRPLESHHRESLERLLQKDTDIIVVRNKADRDCALTPEDEKLLDQFETTVTTSLSPETSEFMRGEKKLWSELTETAKRLTSSEGVLLSRGRHLDCVSDALSALKRARRAVRDERELELIALDLQEALDALGEIVGEVSTDDILGNIFSEFCVGK